jgi:short-subunit dehydrogenase
VRVAVVTGASSGIGEAVARALGRDGWTLLLVARREERLAALSAELGEAAGYEVADLTDPDSARRIAGRVEKDFGRLDLLVNNAGGNRTRGEFAELGHAYVREVMEQNFDSAVMLTEALLPVLRRSAPSAIVNVSSIAGRVARPRVAAYNAAKFALAGWSESLYHEESAHGVHVGLVTPGFISTEGFSQDQLTSKALGRLIVSTPEKAAEAVLAAADGKAEISVPRWYGLLPPLRFLAPWLFRRALGGTKKRR